MNINDIRQMAGYISRKMDEHKDYLILLDQKNGDGDLGISMSDGFHAVLRFLEKTAEPDLGKVMHHAGLAFNEAAPSSLGTILAFGFTGMAGTLKGYHDVSPRQLAEALRAGTTKISAKTGSHPGERTILDSLCPAASVLCTELEAGSSLSSAMQAAVSAARQGAEKTADMLPVHGRAAYYGEKCLGFPDGGAVVGQYIFEALAEYLQDACS